MDFWQDFWLCSTWEKRVLYKQSIKFVHKFILSSSQYLLSGCWFLTQPKHGGLSAPWGDAPQHPTRVWTSNNPMSLSRAAAEKMGLFFLCRVCGVKCRWEHKLWRRHVWKLLLVVILCCSQKMLLKCCSPGLFFHENNFFSQPQPSGQTCLLWSFVYPDWVLRFSTGIRNWCFFSKWMCGKDWVEIVQRFIGWYIPETEFRNSNNWVSVSWCYFPRFGRDQILQLLDWAGFRGRHEFSLLW